MSRRKIFRCSVATLVLTVGLSGCAGPTPVAVTPSSSPPVTELYPTLEDFFDTRWAGVDDEGEPTTFEFHADRTVAIQVGGSVQDDSRDSWRIDNDDTLTIIDRSEGTVAPIVYVGTTDDYRSDIRLHVVYTETGETRSLTIALQR